jgi:hypothetical protein
MCTKVSDMNNTWLNFFTCTTKLSAACKFLGGIRELHATLIMFCNTAIEENYNKNLKRREIPYTTRNSYTLVGLCIDATIPLSGRSNLV